MKFYDITGKSLRKRKNTPEGAYYLDEEGKLKLVPSIQGTKKDVFDFLRMCILETQPSIKDKEIQEIWEFYEGKKTLILKYLEALRAMYQSEGDKWRSISYYKAIRAIKQTKIPIASGEQALQIKGVGKSISLKINEILTKGTLSKIDDRLREELDKQSTVELFMGIWGVGPKRAGEFYALGFRDLTELAEFNLRPQEKIGLKYYDSFQKKTPRKEIQKKSKELESVLMNLNPKSKFIIAGSYRRGVARVGDMDIIISPGESNMKSSLLLREYIKELINRDIIIETLSLGPKKYMGVMKLDNKSIIRLDVFVIDNINWGSAVTYFTGSADFIKELHAQARAIGVKFSQYGLVHRETNEKIPTKTEKDVFSELEMGFVPPEKR